MIALPALAEVAIALLLVALLFAWAYFAQAVAQLIPTGIPYIGSWLRNQVVALADAAYTAQRAVWDHAVTPVVNFIISPITALRNNWAALNNFAASTWVHLYGLATVTLPNVLAYAVAVAESVLAQARIEITQTAAALYQNIADTATNVLNDAAAADQVVRDYATSLVNAARADAAAALLQLANSATQLYNQSIQYALQLAQAATAYADGLFQQVIDYATTAIDTLRADLDADITAVEQYAQDIALTTATAVVGVLTTDIDTAVAAVWPDVVAGATAVEGVLGLDLPDILTGLKGIDFTKPLTAAGSAAAALAISVPILKYMEECGIPNCKNLGGFGNDLSALSALVDSTFLISLLAEAATDPAGAAADIESTLGGIVNGALGTFRSMIGV